MLTHATHWFEVTIGVWENLPQSYKHTDTHKQTHALVPPAKELHYEWPSWCNYSVLIQIDYQTFLTLSDEDLKEVGVSTFGARRKMLLAISGENVGFRSASPSVKVVGGARLLFWKWLTCLSFIADLNKSKRRLSDTPAVKPGYLEGGASGRLPRIKDLEVAAQSNRWWEETDQPGAASDQRGAV